jgi:hypothetical protein
MATLGKYQMLGFTSWKGLTKENHIGAIFQSSPQKATNMMIQLLATHRGKSLETYLSQFPVKYFDTDDEYTWEVIGSSRKNIPLVEARTAAGSVISSGNAGVQGEPFFLVFSEDWFADGNVIVGEKNEAYPLRVLGEPRLEGTQVVYKVELMGGVVGGMPYDELATGKRFSVEYSPVEKEMSRGVGDVRYSSPIAMRNEFSAIRIKTKVPGSMLNKKLAIGIPFIDAAGKKVIANRWMHHVEYTVEETFSEEKNNILMYGRSNRNRNGEYMNFGKSGNVIKQGAGIREQMEISNVVYYNDFSLTLIEDALYELSAAKLGYGDRTFVLRTGERGASQFSKAVLDTVSGWTAFTVNADNVGMVQKTSSKFHTNSLSAGFQFVEFKAPNGVTLKVEVDPLYDDPIRNKILHPKGGVAESYRYDILYIGSTEQPNIQIAKVKGQEEVRGFKPGLRNPFTGQTDIQYMSTDEDSAEIHRMAWLGAFILDPTRTMSIIPSILA